MDGAIVADFITAGTLNANIIRAGVLASANGITSFNLETGELKIQQENNINFYMDNNEIVLKNANNERLARIYASFTGDYPAGAGVLNANQFLLSCDDTTKVLGRWVLSKDKKSAKLETNVLRAFERLEFGAEGEASKGNISIGENGRVTLFIDDIVCENIWYKNLYQQ
jgi:hypothetical protein